MRYAFLPPTVVLACVFTLACTDDLTTSPSTNQGTSRAAGSTFAATRERPFRGTCTFASTLLPPEQGQPTNVIRFHQDEVCHLTHLGLTTASTTETITLTQSGVVFVTTITYTAANGDQLFSTLSGTAMPPDQDGVAQFSGTETVTGGTGRFGDASGSFSVAGSVNLATSTGEFAFTSGTLSY